MGVDRSTFIIDESGKILHAWRNVKVKGHVEEVIDKLKEVHEYSHTTSTNILYSYYSNWISVYE